MQKNESVNKWFDDEYSDLNNAIGIFSNDKVLDWTPIDFKNTNNIYVDDIYSCVYNLKLLYKAKRLRYRNGFLEIYSKENLDSYQEIKNFSDYIIEDNQNNDYIITMLNNISTKQIDIFNAFINCILMMKMYLINLQHQMYILQLLHLKFWDYCMYCLM